MRRHGPEGRERRGGLRDREGRGQARGGRHGRGGLDGESDREDIVAEILARESLGLDLVFECCGEQSRPRPGRGPAQARRDARRRRHPRRAARLVRQLQGAPTGGPRPERPRQNKCLEKAVAMVHTGRIKVDFLATHFFRLDQARDAYETAAERRDGVIKAIVTP